MYQFKNAPYNDEFLNSSYSEIPVLTLTPFNCRSEMVFLPDLSDGETSDGGAGRDNFDGPGRTSSTPSLVSPSDKFLKLIAEYHVKLSHWFHCVYATP